jgi:hypothetical protein
MHQPDPEQFTDATGDDDWDQTLTEAEWRAVAEFFGRFEPLRQHMDFLR